MEARPDAGETQAAAGRRRGASPGERGAWAGLAWAGNEAPEQGAGPGADWLSPALPMPVPLQLLPHWLSCFPGSLLRPGIASRHYCLDTLPLLKGATCLVLGASLADTAPATPPLFFLDSWPLHRPFPFLECPSPIFPLLLPV